MTHTSVTCTHTLCALHNVCHIKEIAECCSVHNDFIANRSAVVHESRPQELCLEGSRSNWAHAFSDLACWHPHMEGCLLS